MKKSNNKDFNKFFEIVKENYAEANLKGTLIKSNISKRKYIADQKFINDFKETDLSSFKEVMNYIDSDCSSLEAMRISIYDDGGFRMVRVD